MTSLNRDTRLSPACLCETTHSAAGSPCASGGDLGVGLVMGMFSCPWEAAQCRMKGQMPQELASLLLCGRSHL